MGGGGEKEVCGKVAHTHTHTIVVQTAVLPVAVHSVISWVLYRNLIGQTHNPPGRLLAVTGGELAHRIDKALCMCVCVCALFLLRG